ncbi:MAG: BrnT family toxin [Mycoplasmataceae bacterium]|nr:BrnT family toxin [Mycoplasmataceae bacterium]
MYEWDESKAKKNLAERNLSFSDAEIVFSKKYITFKDTRYDYGEPRFISFGLLEKRMVVIAHTPRGNNTRIISMRKANSREQKNYQKQLETSWRYER